MSLGETPSEDMTWYKLSVVTAAAAGETRGSLTCGSFGASGTHPPSPIVQGNASPSGSQSERNSLRSNPLTCPIIPAKSFVLCSIRDSRFAGFRLVPSPKRADLPAKERISDPSDTISETHRRSLISMSTRSIVCCLVMFAWSVQFRDRIGPRILRWALLPPS